MKFGRLEIQNFGTIGTAEIDLADRGLILIQGINDDDTSAESNGAGKSTVLDALSWVLFGKTAKGLTGDKVVNRIVGANCRVSITVVDDGARYEITRHRKHKAHRNAVLLHKHATTPPLVDLTKGTDKLTQEEIERILGCSYEVFAAAVYAGQEAMPDLPNMTDRQLKLLIEEAAGITILERAYEAARAQLASEQQTCRGMEVSLQRLRDAHDHARQRKVDGENDIKVWKAEQQRRIMTHQAEGREIITKVRELKASMEAIGDRAVIQGELDRAASDMAGLSAEQDELAIRENAFTAANMMAARAKANAENLAKRHAEVKGAHEKLHAGIGKPCDECGRAHTEDTLDAAAGRRGVAANDAKSAIDKLRKASTDAQSASKSVSEQAHD